MLHTICIGHRLQIVHLAQGGVWFRRYELLEMQEYVIINMKKLPTQVSRDSFFLLAKLGAFFCQF